MLPSIWATQPQRKRGVKGSSSVGPSASVAAVQRHTASGGGVTPAPATTETAASLPPLLKTSDIDRVCIGTLVPPRPGGIGDGGEALGGDSMAAYTDAIGAKLKKATRSMRDLSVATGPQLSAAGAETTYTAAGALLHVRRMQRFPFLEPSEHTKEAAAASLVAQAASVSSDDRLQTLLTKEIERRDAIHQDARLGFRAIMTSAITGLLPLREAFEQSTQRTALLNRTTKAISELQLTEAAERQVGEQELLRAAAALRKACKRVAIDVENTVRFKAAQKMERVAFEEQRAEEKQQLYGSALAAIADAMVLMLVENEEPCREGIVSQERRAHLLREFTRRDDAFDIACDRFQAVRNHIEAQAVELENLHFTIRTEIAEQQERLERQAIKTTMLSERTQYVRDVAIPRRIEELVGTEATWRQTRADAMLQSLWRSALLGVSEFFAQLHEDAIRSGRLFAASQTPSATQASCNEHPQAVMMLLESRFKTSSGNDDTAIITTAFERSCNTWTAVAKSAGELSAIATQEQRNRVAIEYESLSALKLLSELALDVAPVVASVIHSVLMSLSSAGDATSTAQQQPPTAVTAAASPAEIGASSSRRERPAALSVTLVEDGVASSRHVASEDASAAANVVETPPSAAAPMSAIESQESIDRRVLDEDAVATLFVLHQMAAMSSPEVAESLAVQLDFCIAVETQSPSAHPSAQLSRSQGAAVTEASLWTDEALQDAVRLTTPHDPMLESSASAPALTRPPTHLSSRGSSRRGAHAAGLPTSPLVVGAPRRVISRTAVKATL